MSPLTLLPTPRVVQLRAGNYALTSGKRIGLIGAPARDLLFSGRRLRDALRSHAKVEWSLAATASGARDEIGAVLRVGDLRGNSEGYTLDIHADGIQIAAGSPHGVFNGVCTLIQIVEQCGLQLPQLYVADYPDFENRGVMLDISRDKVPTMATLFDLVDMLAAWKVNEFQLYIEHTFAYRNHRLVWEQASPMTEEEILSLDEFCRERFITLVPNQNSFGHMRRWLTHDRYRDLAEAPNGCDTTWGHFDEPFSLNPGDPRSLDLIRELYDEFLPNFSSHHFNVGCDETVDLGQGRSKAVCAERGTGRVYLDFLLKIQREVRARGHTMMFWGDIIVKHPELVPELPRDIIALEWGYDANHPFAEDCAQFAASRIPFYVCPGTSSWNSILGRTDNCTANILSAAENGLEYGAIGLLNTEWGDNGHWQHLPISYLGFVYGAALGWCVETNRALDLPRALDLYAFRDRSGVMGRLAYGLGNVYQSMHPHYRNATVLGRALFQSLAELRDIPDLDPADFASAIEAINRAMAPLPNARMQRADAELIMQEFEHGAELSRHAARRGMLAFETDRDCAAQLKAQLNEELSALIETYDRLWHARNRPGGFKDSVAWMEKARTAYN